MDFIRRCLIWDPRKRMSASEASRHPWVIRGTWMLKLRTPSPSEISTRIFLKKLRVRFEESPSQAKKKGDIFRVYGVTRNSQKIMSEKV